MKNPLLPIVSLLCFAAAAFAQDEYNSTLGPEARALSKELQAIARTSPKRFDAAQDVSKLKAWFIGSCAAPGEDVHLVAYFLPSPLASYVAVFRRDKQLHALWKFDCDARQLYVEGTKLMFVQRPLLHEDTLESFAKVPRETVIDFGALPEGRAFKFHGVSYALPE